MAVHKNSSIDNEYAYMLDSSVFDLNRIHKIIEKYYIKSTIKNEKYIGNVTDESYLETIQKKFPFLSDAFSIFTLNTDMKIHVDTHRKACINFIYPNGSKSYTKLNFRKFLLTNFGMNILPKSHTVDRYLDTISHLGAKNDGLGLDYFLSKEDEIEVPHSEKPFITFAIGGTHFTKILPTAKIISICNKQEKQVILIGGKEDFEKGDLI